MAEEKPKTTLLGKVLVGIIIAGTLIAIYFTVKLFIVSQTFR